MHWSWDEFTGKCCEPMPPTDSRNTVKPPEAVALSGSSRPTANGFFISFYDDVSLHC